MPSRTAACALMIGTTASARTAASSRRCRCSGVNDSRRRRRVAGRRRHSAGTRVERVGEQRVRLVLADRHQPHRRRDTSPRAACSMNASSAAAPVDPGRSARPTPNATGSVSRARPSGTARRDRGAIGMQLLPGLQQPHAHRALASRAVDEGRSASTSSSSARQRRQSPSSTNACQARRDRRALDARERLVERDVQPRREGRRPSRCRPDAVAASRPSECAKRADRKQAVAEVQQRRAVRSSQSSVLVTGDLRRPA